MWELVERAAAQWPDDPMLVSRQGDRCSFAEFRDRAARMAAGLAALGVGEGTIVSWILPTWVDTVVLAAALSRLGAVQNPIIGISRDREVAFCVGESHSQLRITPETFGGFDFAAMGARIGESQPHLRHVVVGPGSFPNGDPLLLDDPAEPAPDTTTWICYTSGTTASPKGARHCDATVGAFSTAMGERMQVEHGDRYALVFPFPHIGGIGLLFLSLRTGCTHLLDDAVDPVATVRFLADNDCTHAGTGPAFFNMFLAAQQHQTEPLFPHLKACPSGGTPTPATYHERIRDELGGVVVCSYGLTEAPVLSCGRVTDPAEQLQRTEGQPLPGVEVRVVGSDGSILATGVAGEICVRGPQVMLGYQDPALDVAAFDGDGFYRTGDLGHLDSNGCIVITGRLKDVIIRNGENISATEVEGFLHGIDGIVEAAVVGLADERTGETVCAFVVCASEPLSLEEVRAALTDAGLRRHALPTRLEICSTLQRNPAGKVLKSELLAGIA